MLPVWQLLNLMQNNFNSDNGLISGERIHGESLKGL
jgi:hypothetical protein